MNWAARGTLSLEGKRQRQTAAEPAAAGAQKIFVVEDDLDIARLVRHHLEGAGFQVRGYTSNAGVLADAQKERPCLLLLDIMVPGGDGLDLCRQVRQSGAPLAATPVVFLTAKTAEADRIFALETGPANYITRPSTPRDLRAGNKAVLPRCEPPRAPASIGAGDLSIAPDPMPLSVRGKTPAATATEFRLL